MHGLDSARGIEVISSLRHHLSDSNSPNSPLSFVLGATAHGPPVNFNHCSRKALLQQLLRVRNVEGQRIAFVMICSKHLFGIIPNLFRPHSMGSLHLLAVRRLLGPRSIGGLLPLAVRRLFGPHLKASLHLLTARRRLLGLHCLCRTLLFQSNTGDISAISIKSWLNYSRMNAFGAMKRGST